MLYCCRMDAADAYSYSDCGYKYGGYGVSLSCDGDSVVEGICGSGRDADCSGQYHMIQCCTGGFGDGSWLASTGACEWHYASYGTELECPYDSQAIFGRCGSGRDADCNGGSAYHGIKCCQMNRVYA